MGKYNDGTTIDITTLSPLELEEVFSDFSEGNLGLKELLYYCYNNGVETRGCCIGHEEKHKLPYIAFEMSSNFLEYLYSIINNPFLKDKIEINFINNTRCNVVSIKLKSYDLTTFNEIKDSMSTLIIPTNTHLNLGMIDYFVTKHRCNLTYKYNNEIYELSLQCPDNEQKAILKELLNTHFKLSMNDTITFNSIDELNNFLYELDYYLSIEETLSSNRKIA